MNKQEFFEWLGKKTNAQDLFECGLFFPMIPESIKLKEVDFKECVEGDYAGEEYKVYQCVTEFGETFNVKLWGIYRSYDGTTFVGWKEVYPKQVTKVVWE
jgi:hypothetical protein